MQRRALWSVLSATATAMAVSKKGFGMEPSAAALLPGQYEHFEDWLTASRKAAMDYLKQFGVADTERFMKLLALWTCAMPDAPDPAWQAMPGAHATLEMATVASGRPFVVSAFRMAPGCILPLHCHPGGGGITLCTAGSMAIQHFELCEDQPPYSATGAQADVRQVQVAQIAHRQVTWFTPTQSNLHQFHAGPQGAMGFEIAVQWQGGGEFSFLKLERPLPVDHFELRSRLRGKWVGMSLAAAYA
jgi:hypothetical protein